MKCTMNEKPKTEKTEYPKLMKSKAFDYVILVHNANPTMASLMGMVVWGTVNKDVGDYSNDWSADCFEDYHGKIELEQD